ncbi:MAG: imidazole glycerol phosphate synthase subunit HisH, partial [Cyanobacteria bacterium P01_H01_bin.74]
FNTQTTRMARRKLKRDNNTNSSAVCHDISPIDFACTVGIIDYGLGNVQSVANALRILGATPVITNHPDKLSESDGLILPGVGGFSEGMANLQDCHIIDALNTLVFEVKKPFLGICLGMQLLAKTGHEGNPTTGLGWVDADVIRFDFSAEKNADTVCKSNGGFKKNLKVPHVGWNDVMANARNTLIDSSVSVSSFYFVHSYHMQCHQSAQWVSATCKYGQSVVAMIEQRNIMGTQFHPEKSQKAGLALLKRFLLKTSVK